MTGRAMAADGAGRDARRQALDGLLGGTGDTPPASLDLSGVGAAGIVARSARLDGALLEGADFSDADMSGASLAGIVGGEICFEGAMLEDASFARASMRYGRLREALLDGANFEGADLWGCDLSHADADGTVFRGARLDEADLSDTNLTHADFSRASLRKVNLAGSRLHGAIFTDARLDGADLSGADLSETTLVRVNLTTCNLRHARLAGAWLSGTRMRVDQLGGAVGEEVAGEYAAARTSYLTLERNLVSLGNKEEASWAYRKARRMWRYHEGAEARAAWRRRDWAAFAVNGYGWTADRFVEWLCNYGESLSRIMRAFGILIVIFAGLYGLTGGLIPEGAEADRPQRSVLDLVSYSALNMLTSNPPEIGVKPVGRVTNLLVGIQGASGIVLMGLFGFVLGNRLRR